MSTEFKLALLGLIALFCIGKYHNDSKIATDTGRIAKVLELMAKESKIVIIRADAVPVPRKK